MITPTLLAEIGDIGRFSDFDQLLAPYAGVHSAERSSGSNGSNPETAWHMSTAAGNSHLRAAAYRMALVGLQHNPVIAAHVRAQPGTRQPTGSEASALRVLRSRP